MVTRCKMQEKNVKVMKMIMRAKAFTRFLKGKKQKKSAGRKD